MDGWVHVNATPNSVACEAMGLQNSCGRTESDIKLAGIRRNPLAKFSGSNEILLQNSWGLAKSAFKIFWVGQDLIAKLLGREGRLEKPWGLL